MGNTGITIGKEYYHAIGFIPVEEMMPLIACNSKISKMIDARDFILVF
jgi:hypothetical protein